MNNTATVFEKMLSPEVRDAFLLRKEGSYNISPEELAELKEYILSDKCKTDIKRLCNRDFFLSIPHRTLLKKKSSQKKRTIYRFLAEEKMLMKLMAFVLHDYDDIYEDSVYSFRIGKHVSRIFYDIRKNDLCNTKWVLKSDIKSYGDNVQPGILADMLDALFKDTDPDLCWFLRTLLMRGRFYADGRLMEGSTGALSGCPLTTFFENVYLKDVDMLIRKECDYYCRYADDIAIFSSSQEEAKGIYIKLKDLFSERGLSFNEDKTDILMPGEKFDLLGFSIEGREYDISKHSMKSIMWRMNHKARKLVRCQKKYGLSREETMKKMIDRIDMYFFGRGLDTNELNWVDWSFRILTRCDSLRKLDNYCQECIRYVGSGGKRTDSKYRVRYKTMQRMGYRTLVHAFYHGIDENDKRI
ncbi:Retron-type reverse transcriptase [Lachnospiraceae bacterium JC7]|nr:Retron-type reverse transcriptase [Lachnospiraceae bacterium JC7]